MNHLFFYILVIGSSLHCAVKKHDGPPLFIRDIYTNGKPDKYFQSWISAMKRNYPLLTNTEIVDCIEFCNRLKDKQHDIAQEFQDLELWKAVHIADIKDKKTCFKEYKQQRLQ